MARPHKLARARSRLQRHLSEGWQRAVFASPQNPGQEHRERVLEGPGEGPLDEEGFAALMQSAKEAAREGLVKQVYVIDDIRRIEVDARHGIPRERTRDAATLEKMMGGKRRALRPDRSEALLRSIGIMNADGTISARHARKYKQVNHLVELCRPTWTKLREARAGTALADEPLHVLDLACGNSYLCFVLAEAFRLESIPSRILGVDLRDDVVERSRARAEELGFSQLEFSRNRIADAGVDARQILGDRIDMMISLHACDTATDEALALAIENGTSTIFCVPCCQAELARDLARDQAGSPTARAVDPSGPTEASTGTGSSPSPDANDPAGGVQGQGHQCPVPAILRHGLLRRAYAETLTDALRIEILDACGYAVTLLEFVDSEHSAKNLLIRAHRRSLNAPFDRSQWRLDAVRSRCEALGLRPRLLDALMATDAQS